MDLIILLCALIAVGLVVRTWTNWSERRTEFRNYLGHPPPPQAPPAGDYEHFAQVWRQHHGGYALYCQKTLGAPASRLSLGAYLRHCELTAPVAAESPSGAAGTTLDSGERRPARTKSPGPPPTRPVHT